MRYIAIAAMALLSTAVAAQNKTLNIVNAAAPSLQVSPDAKAGGMGDVGIATDADAGSMLYNLAKITFAPTRSGASATYTPWMRDVAEDMSLAAISGFHQLSGNDAVGAAVRYFSMGNVDILDYGGNKLQTAHPSEFSIDLGYARKLGEQFSTGVTLRYLNSNLMAGRVDGVNYKKGNAVAADISFFYNGVKDNQGWTAGLSLSNLGNKISYADGDAGKGFLPASMNLGFAYRENWEGGHHFMAGGDIQKLMVPEMPDNAEGLKDYYNKGVVNSWFSSMNNRAWQFGLGTEYSYMEKFYLRLGYRSQTYTDGHWQYVTAGLGFRFDIAAINFSYIVPTGDKITRAPFANTVKMGLVLGWGAQKD